MGKICGPMDRNTMDDQKPLLADMVKCRRYRPLIYQLDRWNPLMSWRDTPLFCFQAAYPITSSIRVIVDKEVRYRHIGEPPMLCARYSEKHRQTDTLSLFQIQDCFYVIFLCDWRMFLSITPRAFEWRRRLNATNTARTWSQYRPTYTECGTPIYECQ